MCLISHQEGWKREVSYSHSFYAIPYPQSYPQLLGIRKVLFLLDRRFAVIVLPSSYLETFTRIVIGVDPAVTAGEGSDETGIIIVGKTGIEEMYVLEDLSCQGSPTFWAQRVIEAYHTYKADKVVSEVNQGGDLVETILRSLDPHVSFKAVRATRGKIIRAEPIAALYEQGKVFHLKPFAKLEEQLCTYVPGKTKKSPDRMDALVWALTELCFNASYRQDLRVTVI